MICPCEKCYEENYITWEWCPEPCPEYVAYEKLAEELITMEGYDEDDEDGIFLI